MRCLDRKQQALVSVVGLSCFLVPKLVSQIVVGHVRVLLVRGIILQILFVFFKLVDEGVKSGVHLFNFFVLLLGY